MSNVLPHDPVYLLLGSIIFIFALLYLREYILRKRQDRQQQQISDAVKQKSLEFIKASETAENQVIASSKYSSAKLEQLYKDNLHELFKASQDATTASLAHFIQYMNDLQEQSSEFEASSQETTKQRINQLFQRLETRLSDFLIKTENTTTSSIELELRSSRQLIDTYKTQQLQLIDENIIAMMEQTLNLVLAKKLSLKDQLDLVYEALEKAKVEKFVV